MSISIASHPSPTTRDSFLWPRPDWFFGHHHYYCAEEEAWWKRHAIIADRWLGELVEARDPWWQSAMHACRCLVSSCEHDMSWRRFRVRSFVFDDLAEGGTVGFFGCPSIFFDHLVEALRRFVIGGVIEPAAGERWIAELTQLRMAYDRFFSTETSERERRAIRRRHLPLRAPARSV